MSYSKAILFVTFVLCILLFKYNYLTDLWIYLTEINSKLTKEPKEKYKIRYLSNTYCKIYI